MLMTSSDYSLEQGEREKKRLELAATLEHTLAAVLRAMPERELATSTAENEARRKWMLEAEGKRPFETDHEK